MSPSPIFPGPVAGQHQSGLRRALRLAALVPVVAGSLALGTASFAQAEPDATPVTQEPVVQEPTTTTDEPTTTNEPTTTTDEPATSTTEEPTTTTEEPTTVTPVPELPGLPEVIRPVLDEVVPGNGSLSISWLAPELEQDVVVFLYQVVVMDGDVVKGVRFLSEDVRQATVAGLVNESDYTVLVRALTSGGVFESLLSDVVEPTADAVDAVLAKVTATVTKKAYSATASWAAPASDGGSPITAYVVNAVDNSTGKLVAWRTVGSDVRSASIAPLAKGIEYTVNVFAVTAAGFGDVDSEDIVGSITGDSPVVPAAPAASAYATDAGSVVATWLPATELGAPVEGYNVVLMQDGKMLGWTVRGADHRSGSVAGYDKAKDADVYVFATSIMGYGSLTKVAIEALEVPAEA